MKKILLFLCVLFLAVTSFGKNIKTLVVTTTPQMHCESCENKIKNNIRFEKGVRSIETDISEQTVTIVYDADKTSEDEIIKAFTKFNYTARKINEGEKVEMHHEDGKCGNM
ncbi:MAG: heavy-metal-associated domain-containing protein [Bacteroidales bacterium]|jgi:copper chaperone CopZ|nr:heavy-metal-associated domain-containing protein [Bacteroidales bacterium]